ncbi:MAG: hypothetical protein SVX43_23290 [Cyanobacteriota bacterium]|nr:hypothetical protein [Cyanobacteriota bacterium]
MSLIAAEVVDGQTGRNPANLSEIASDLAESIRARAQKNRVSS